MDLGRNGRGELLGTLTAGADRVTIPLLNVAIDGSTIVFYGRTDQQFHAALPAAGKTLSGTASVSGYELPFSMSRTGDAKIDPPPTSPLVTKQLEGVWSGALSAGGRTLHLAVTIANQPDGTAVGQSVSLDEGSLTVPLVISQSGRAVTIATRGIVTSLRGHAQRGRNRTGGHLDPGRHQPAAHTGASGCRRHTVMNMKNHPVCPLTPEQASGSSVPSCCVRVTCRSRCGWLARSSPARHWVPRSPVTCSWLAPRFRSSGWPRRFMAST